MHVLWSLRCVCTFGLGNILPGGNWVTFLWKRSEAALAAPAAASISILCCVFEGPKGPSPGNAIVSICFWQNTQSCYAAALVRAPQSFSMHQNKLHHQYTRSDVYWKHIDDGRNKNNNKVSLHCCLSIYAMLLIFFSRPMTFLLDWIGLVPEGFGSSTCSSNQKEPLLPYICCV